MNLKALMRSAVVTSISCGSESDATLALYLIAQAKRYGTIREWLEYMNHEDMEDAYVQQVSDRTYTVSNQYGSELFTVRFDGYEE